MFKIKSVEDIKSVSEKIIGQFVFGKITYFSLTIGEESEFSSCFFTPITEVSKHSVSPPTNKKYMTFVEDYEKLLKVLLSHPKISNIKYDEKNNVISAVFESPYLPDQGEEDEF